jgi:predicted secreted Zn-dependent protease
VFPWRWEPNTSIMLYWSKERWILDDTGQRNVGYWTIMVKGTLDIERYWSKERWILDDNGQRNVGYWTIMVKGTLDIER